MRSQPARGSLAAWAVCKLTQSGGGLRLPSLRVTRFPFFLWCAGDFVVGEDALGYGDIGEEVDWGNADAADEEAPKPKGGKEAGSKRKTAGQAAPVDRARFQKLMHSAAAKPRSKPVDDKTTDALLDDILGNLGGDLDS